MRIGHTPARNKTITESLKLASEVQRTRFRQLEAFLLALGNDVQLSERQHYHAFSRGHNFASVEICHRQGSMVVYLPNPSPDLHFEPGFTRDVRSIGHHGTGDLEISIRSDADLERAKSLLLQSYEAS